MDFCGIFTDVRGSAVNIYIALAGLIIAAVIIVIIMNQWVGRVTLYELFKGLWVTQSTALSPKVTVQFPEENLPTSPRFRGLLALRRYPNGEERCIGCKLCEATCPALAITIETAPRDDGSRRTTRFDIDMFKCINCGLCEQSCPVDSIVLTPEQHYTVNDRGLNILTKDKLLKIGEITEDRLAKDRASIYEGDG